ncbi:MAG: 50S ribosomal protein L9 [Coriobacteriia bacterium]|nr:50S ribosomal protein L9 [Coriobacteriia bacterium]
MKVILTQEVKGKGGEGDVIDVARGYAVNYLFARKMAIEATSGNLKQLEQRMHNVRNREATRLNGAASIAAGLEGKVVRIEAKVGEEGRLYGSITSQMIEDAIAQQYELAVDRKQRRRFAPLVISGSKIENQPCRMPCPSAGGRCVRRNRDRSSAS